MDREISLQGNAFFGVKHKADNQFFKDYANGITNGVPGTEFIVNACNKAAGYTTAGTYDKPSADWFLKINSMVFVRWNIQNTNRKDINFKPANYRKAVFKQ